MKKLFTSIGAVLLSVSLNAQIGAVAPDFTVTDVNGASHDLYDYLNGNKLVILDVSATWCGPCWGFHSAHYLEEIYNQYGPNGTNQVVVLFYEGDAATGATHLNGTASSQTQGNWLTGSSYPFVNESPIQLNMNIYAPLGFPTINVICPSDKRIKEDLWDVHAVAGTTEAKLATMKAHIDDYLATCLLPLGIEDNSIITASIAPNPSSGITTITLNNAIEDATVTVYSLTGQELFSQKAQISENKTELDLSNLNAGTYLVKISSGNLNSKMIQVVKN